MNKFIDSVKLSKIGQEEVNKINKFTANEKMEILIIMKVKNVQAQMDSQQNSTILSKKILQSILSKLFTNWNKEYPQISVLKEFQVTLTTKITLTLI